MEKLSYGKRLSCFGDHANWRRQQHSGGCGRAKTTVRVCVLTLDAVVRRVIALLFPLPPLPFPLPAQPIPARTQPPPTHTSTLITSTPNSPQSGINLCQTTIHPQHHSISCQAASTPTVIPQLSQFRLDNCHEPMPHLILLSCVLKKNKQVSYSPLLDIFALWCVIDGVGPLLVPG